MWIADPSPEMAKYGQNYKGDQLGVTAQSLIVKGDKPLVAFLGLDLNFWNEKAKAEEEREAYLTAFKEKTEALRQKSQEQKIERDKRNLWNVTHHSVQRKF